MILHRFAELSFLRNVVDTEMGAEVVVLQIDFASDLATATEEEESGAEKAE